MAKKVKQSIFAIKRRLDASEQNKEIYKTNAQKHFDGHVKVALVVKRFSQANKCKKYLHKPDKCIKCLTSELKDVLKDHVATRYLHD